MRNNLFLCSESLSAQVGMRPIASDWVERRPLAQPGDRVQVVRLEVSGAVPRIRHRAARRHRVEGAGRIGLGGETAPTFASMHALFHLHAFGQSFLLPGPADAIATKCEAEPSHRCHRRAGDGEQAE